MEDKTLGAAIRRRRRMAGLTLGQVAVRAKVSKVAISKIERGLVGEPGIMTITGIALALDCTPNDLLVEAGILPEVDNIIWSQPLRIMQRAINLYPVGSPEREHIERIIIAQAEAYLQFKEGAEEDESSL